MIMIPFDPSHYIPLVLNILEKLSWAFGSLSEGDEHN